MMKLSFTIAAIYGASLARAQTCTAQNPLPDQSQSYSVTLGEQNFNYLDACPQDQKVTWEEFEALIADIGLAGADRAENVRIFQMMDLDNNHEISREELLQYYRAKYNPIDVEGNLAPFDQTSLYNKVFDYLRCRANNNENGLICNDLGYSREDLKLSLPLLYNLDNIINDYVSFEAYVSYEYRLRDIDNDGIVNQWEHNEYNGHYRFMRGFWNYSKGEGDVRETLIDDNGIMTKDQWMQQDNKLVKRAYPNTDIPVDHLEGWFKSLDTNRDDVLTWWEYWTSNQQSHKQWYNFNPWFSEIDQDDAPIGQGVLTEDEIRQYYTAQSAIGLISADEIEIKVAELLSKYGNGKTEIHYWPMWGRYNWLEHQKEAGARHEENQNLYFDQNTWFVNDLNRDQQWTYDELIQGMTHDEAVEVYDLFGKDPITQDLTYDEVKALVPVDINEQLYCEMYAFSKPLDQINLEDPEVYLCLNVETFEELTALYASVDKDSDGTVTKEEVCRYYISDTDFICAGQPREIQIISPDFLSQAQFEGFWAAFDSDYMNADQTEVSRDDFIMAVTEVLIFNDISDENILNTFDHYDLDNDGILTKTEAYHVFNEGANMLEVAEQTIEMWDSVDQNEDDSLDQTEFLAAVQLLTSSEILPEIPSADVIMVFDSMLSGYNADQAEPVEALPLSSIISSLKEKAPLMWDALVADVTQQP